MERGFWITLSNSAGILDSAFARTEEQAMELAIELLSGFPDRDEGDMPGRLLWRCSVALVR